MGLALPHRQISGRRSSCQSQYHPLIGSNLAQKPSCIYNEKSSTVFPSNIAYNSSLESFREQILALQVKNLELNLLMKQEERRRKETEKAFRKEKEYVRKLEHTLQVLMKLF